MTVGVKYLLRGGPRDGELIEPPPVMLATVAAAIAEAAGGRRVSAPRVISQGWVYEFSATEAGVLDGREATEDELLVDAAFAELRAEDDRRRRMFELSPVVLSALKESSRLLEGDECVAAKRGDVAIFIAHGATAAAWEEALAALPDEHRCSPQEIADEAWGSE